MIRTCLGVLAIVVLVSPVRVIGDPSERTSTVADRQLVNLTVYNGGTALVHDRRVVRINEGLNRIAWRDVSADMDPTSALLETTDPSSKITVLEQNFDFDLLDPSALLQKYVGRQVTVVHEARFTGERDTRDVSQLGLVLAGSSLGFSP